MAQKIVSPRAELTVLRAICHKDPKIAGTVLGAVDEGYFDSPESVELFTHMKSHVAATGELPRYKLMIDDIDISQEARSFFRDSEATIQSIEEAHKSVKILNRYRQLRTLYQLASHIDQQMQKGKIDLDSLLEESANRVSAARTSKSTKDAFLHFGTGNNSADMVKKLLHEENNEDTIPTGIKPFDEESGGFMRGSLVTLGASSGGGKCGILDTRIQVSTLRIVTDDLIFDVEPEDLIVLVGGEVRRVEFLIPGDDIEIDPQLVSKHFADYFGRT